MSIIKREYQGDVFMFREDGYFNMTKAAKVFGKNVNEFLRLPSQLHSLRANERCIAGTFKRLQD